MTITETLTDEIKPLAPEEQFEAQLSALNRLIEDPTNGELASAATKLYAEIYLKLRQKGKPIGTNDMWIAAIALEQDNVLLTLDAGFSEIPDLMLATI